MVDATPPNVHLRLVRQCASRAQLCVRASGGLVISQSHLSKSTNQLRGRRRYALIQGALINAPRKLETPALVVPDVCSRADYQLIPGDNRTVIGNLNDPFSTTTTLPGYYDKLVSGIHDITIKDGDCSTPFFKCSMVKNSDTMSTVSISGYMSYGLKWIIFSSSQNLIPISIVFLTNGVWNDLATGKLGIPTQRKLTIGRSNIVFYSQGGKKPVNNISDYPQIMNLGLSSKTEECLLTEFKQPHEVFNFEGILSLIVRLFKPLAQDFAGHVWWDGCE
nr:unnamed protein product [Spirometra erinaceieuropaei]